MSPRSSVGAGAAITIDVEEWFHVCGHGAESPVGEWDSLPSAVERSVDRTLELLDEARLKGTAFVLGWVARRHPHLVRRVLQAGHEIASHGMFHRRLDSLSPAVLRGELRDSRSVLQDVSGTEVAGFRAPEWSVRSPGDPSLAAIAEAGYEWSSSISRTPGLGLRSNPSRPSWISTPNGDLLEIPPLSHVSGLPVGGSWLSRLLPLPVVLRAAQQMADLGAPAVFTVHPWEFDVAHPPDAFPLAARLMHHAGLGRAEDRLLAIAAAIGAGSFVPLGQLARAIRAGSPAKAPIAAVASF
jgi:polysaccharide deacetylase family protein (PEP-CTERM system associated)